MKKFGLTSISGVGFVLAVLCLVFFSSCSDKEGEAAKWELFPDPERHTVQVECNADSVLYTNNLNTRVLLRFNVDSKCEFAGRVEKLNATDSVLAYREIKGYASGQQLVVKGSFELEANEQFYVNCQRGTTVLDEGCGVTWWLVAKMK